MIPLDAQRLCLLNGELHLADGISVERMFRDWQHVK